MSVLAELLCARCGHPADLHGLEDFPSPCMHRRDGECECRVTWERIEDRAIMRMSAGLPINTESDPDAEGRARQARSSSAKGDES